MQTNSPLQTALSYLKQGISVVAADPKNKRPLFKWIEFQKTLPTEQQVRSMFQQHPKAMVSIVTGELSHIMVVDCDSPEAIKTIEDALPESFETVIAVTPRGGRHYYFKCENGKWQTKASVLPNIDIRANGGVVVSPPSRNEAGGQYQWLNQLVFDPKQLQPMPDALCRLLQSAEAKKKYVVDVGEIKELFSEGRRDNDLFHLALALRRSGESKEYILQVLIKFTEGWKDNNNVKYLSEKVVSAFQHEEKKARNLTEEIREWVLSSSGVFLSSDIIRCLQVSSRDEIKNVSKVLSRMVSENIIVREGDKNGCFRKVEDKEEVIDFVNVITEYIDLKFPFQIENYVRIMPKNIVVIAGEPDSGKTAFLLNIVRSNMMHHKIFYFSSEMGAMEMQDRLRNFDYPITEWRFTPIERSSGFADVIRPDDVNIIDFLEISDNFYQVSGRIKEIYDKLRKGICIIALQKNKGTDFGLGGMRSLEKPRLYLSMQPGEIKIVKAKNWVSPDKNPNKLTMKYTLYKGCHFNSISGWIKPLD